MGYIGEREQLEEVELVDPEEFEFEDAPAEWPAVTEPVPEEVPADGPARVL